MHCIQCFVWCFFGPRIIVTPIVDVSAAPTNRLAGLAEPPKPNEVLSDPVQTVFECQLLGHGTMVISSQRAYRLAAKPGQQKRTDRSATDAMSWFAVNWNFDGLKLAIIGRQPPATQQRDRGSE